MDIDKSLDAMEGWSLNVLEGVTKKLPPSKIIDLCKNINTEGRKLEYRQSGIKQYTQKLEEAKQLSKSVKKHLEEVKAAGDSGVIDFRSCREKTEYKYNFQDTRNRFGGKFFGGTYELMKGRELLICYDYFIAHYAKTEIEFIQRAITEMRAAAQVIISAMEKVTKLAKDKKEQDQLKVKTEALYVSVKKDAASMYNSSRREIPITGGNKRKVILRELKFDPPNHRDLNGWSVNYDFYLDIFKIVDFIKNHLKNCKKKS